MTIFQSTFSVWASLNLQGNQMKQISFVAGFICCSHGWSCKMCYCGPCSFEGRSWRHCFGHSVWRQLCTCRQQASTNGMNSQEGIWQGYGTCLNLLFDFLYLCRAFVNESFESKPAHITCNYQQSQTILCLFCAFFVLNSLKIATWSWSRYTFSTGQKSWMIVWITI